MFRWGSATVFGYGLSGGSAKGIRLEGCDPGSSDRTQVAENTFGQRLLDFIVTRNGLNNTRSGIGPKGMIRALSLEVATSAPQLLFQRAALRSNRYNGFDGIFGQTPTHVLQTIFKDEQNRLAQAFFRFVHRFGRGSGDRRLGSETGDGEQEAESMRLTVGDGRTVASSGW